MAARSHDRWKIMVHGSRWSGRCRRGKRWSRWSQESLSAHPARLHSHHPAEPLLFQELQLRESQLYSAAAEAADAAG